MGISVEKSILQHLTQRALDQNIHELARVKVHRRQLYVVIQSSALHPFHGENFGSAQIRVDFRHKYI